MDLQNHRLRVRINQIDYSLQPSDVLDNTVLPRVPIIRIYGESSVGKKTCVHIHQVYPYFFVEYTGKMNPKSVNQHIAMLTHSLNHAIAVSMKRNPRQSQSVRAIILVKGVHFYGFHSSYSPFLKVLIADPALVNRAATLLQSGAIMKTRFRVYESHLSYVLQFLCDFGLYGCGWIELADAWQRGRDYSADTSQFSQQQDMIFQFSPYYCQTRMPLEVDATAHQILNRHRITARNMHHKLDIPAPPLPPEPVVLSVRELWDDERRRRIARGLHPSPDIPKDPSESSRNAGREWAAEVRWWEEIQKRIENEGAQQTLQTGDEDWERWVMTTFESTEALWEAKWRSWKPARRPEDLSVAKLEGEEEQEPQENPYASASQGLASQYAAEDANGDIDVDEDMLESQEVNRLVEYEESAQQKRETGDTEKRAHDVSEDPAVDDGLPPEPQYDDDNAYYEDATPKGTSCKKHLFESPTSTQSKQERERSCSVNSDRTTMPSKPHFSVANIDISNEGPILDLSPENPFLDEDLISTAKAEEASRSLGAQIHDPLSPDVKSGSEHNEDERGVVQEYGCSPRTPPFHVSSHDENAAGENIEGSAHAQNDIEVRPRKRQRLSSVQPSVNALPSSLPASSSHITSSRPLGTPFPRIKAQASTSIRVYTYAATPPSVSELLSSLQAHGIPTKIYQDPWYSIESDAPEHPREYAGLVYHLKGGTGTSILKEWSSTEDTTQKDIKLHPDGISGWEYASAPPSAKAVRRWLEFNQLPSPVHKPKKPSQISGPTQAHPYGLKTTPTILPTTTREKGDMTALAMEIYAPSRGHILPDPGTDPVVALFYAFYDPNCQRVDNDAPFQCKTGVIVVKNSEFDPKKLRNWQLEVVDTELDLLNKLVDLMQELDPDIVTGWEVQVASWGYLRARASTYDFDLGEMISRAPGRRASGGVDQWGVRTTSTFKLVGRHVLNFWRIMRSELSLTSYSFENVVFNVLRRRTPRYTSSTLTGWYNSTVPEHVSRLFSYFLGRTRMVLEMIEVAEVITKYSEFARVFGVDFFSVISRGSQFKVESFMFRIAKPESFVLLSPSRQDVGRQNAAECMPLIMEPLSAFYNSPLLVLDFQSLYPSIMIAYNYCYSTCLGRVVDFKGQNKFGVTELRQPAGLLNTLKEHINVSPNGMIFVNQDVRKGLLARMLTELLNTRVMVKQAMKGVRDDKALQRVLDARQLSLKFIANVTYGYTSATYSGRMPAVEIADAIVQSGRETLEKAIRVIDSTQRWGAKVVYGDTDSLFIYLSGKTKDQAFRIGHDIADTITALNPAPIKLKFEKVYLGCVLMAKKRYVGFKYENPDDQDPVFDAKGIETVRRDGIPAQQKMVETCLKILFRTQDLSQVKDYCCTTWAQILENKASIQDFIFSKEVRLGTYSDRGPPPPGAAVAARRLAEDPNDEAQYGDRIPYVIIREGPTRLVDRAVAPEGILNDSHKHLDAVYYITRVLIPPLERIFNLVGADVRSWYEEMPKALRVDDKDALMFSPRKAQRQAALASRFQIDEHFLSSHCLTCGVLTDDYVCDDCRFQPQETISRILALMRRTEKQLTDVQLVCATCSGTPTTEPIHCESLDCPWLFERKKVEHRTEGLETIQDIVDDLQYYVDEFADSEGNFEIVEDDLQEEVEEEVLLEYEDSEDDELEYL